MPHLGASSRKWPRNRTGENRTGEPRPLANDWTLSWALPCASSWDVSWELSRGVLEGLKTGALVGTLVAWVKFRFRLLCASPSKKDRARRTKFGECCNKAQRVRFGTQLMGWRDLTELAPQNSMRAKIQKFGGSPSEGHNPPRGSPRKFASQRGS